jgi:hypothetical protein
MKYALFICVEEASSLPRAAVSPSRMQLRLGRPRWRSVVCESGTGRSPRPPTRRRSGCEVARSALGWVVRRSDEPNRRVQHSGICERRRGGGRCAAAPRGGIRQCRNPSDGRVGRFKPGSALGSVPGVRISHPICPLIAVGVPIIDLRRRRTHLERKGGTRRVTGRTNAGVPTVPTESPTAAFNRCEPDRHQPQFTSYG